MDDTYHIFEWGVDSKLVHLRSYNTAGDKGEVVSEAHWFWHPGERSICGVAVAKGLDITLFDYVVSAEGATLES